MAAARNEGILKATGEWITFVDPDDWCELDFYEEIFKNLRERDVDIFLSGGYFKEYEDKNEIRYNLQDFEYSTSKERETLMVKVLAPKYGKVDNKKEASAGLPWDKLYRLSFIKKNRLLFDTDFHPLEDLLFNFYAYDKAEKVAGCSFVGYHYRMIDSSSTHRFSPNMPIMNYKFIQKVHKYIEEQKRENNLLLDALYARAINVFSLSLQCCYFHTDNSLSYKEKAIAIQKWKKKDLYYKAIYKNGNKLLSKKQFVLQKLLQRERIFPVLIAVKLHK